MTKDDISKLNAILEVIAKDEELVTEFAAAIGEDAKEFADWIEVVQIS